MSLIILYNDQQYLYQCNPTIKILIQESMGFNPNATNDISKYWDHSYFLYKVCKVLVPPVVYNTRLVTSVKGESAKKKIQEMFQQKLVL